MRVIVYTQNDVAAPAEDDKSTVVAASSSDAEVQGVEYINMANGRVTATIGWLIWLLITGLNVYLISMLVLGRG